MVELATRLSCLWNVTQEDVVQEVVSHAEDWSGRCSGCVKVVLHEEGGTGGCARSCSLLPGFATGLLRTLFSIARVGQGVAQEVVLHCEGWSGVAQEAVCHCEGWSGGCSGCCAPLGGLVRRSIFTPRVGQGVVQEVVLHEEGGLGGCTGDCSPLGGLVRRLLRRLLSSGRVVQEVA